MSILVGGTVALDTIESPHGHAEKVLGGSAAYFAYAAGFLAPVSIVGVVGEDFPENYRKVLADQGVDLTGIEISSNPTFNWHGRYHEDMNIRDTISVDLSIFDNYTVSVPENLADSKLVCLANMSPTNQLQLLDACNRPDFVLADTMNLWIEVARQDLEKLLQRIDLLILNDSEAKMLADVDNIITAGRRLLESGPKYICIKKGEHGVALFARGEYFVTGAYPLESVLDPTGAGDCFAGGLAGHLARTGRYDFESLKEAMLPATTAASFCVEDFSFHRLIKATPDEFQDRLAKYKSFVTLPGSVAGGAC